MTARAATHCEILGIDRKGLETILKEFPVIQRYIKCLQSDILQHLLYILVNSIKLVEHIVKTMLPNNWLQ